MSAYQSAGQSVILCISGFLFNKYELKMTNDNSDSCPPTNLPTYLSPVHS